MAATETTSSLNCSTPPDPTLDFAQQIRDLASQALSAPPEVVFSLARLYRTSLPMPAFKGAGAIAFGPPEGEQKMAAWVVPGGFNLERAQAHLLKLLNTQGSIYQNTEVADNRAALRDVLKYLDTPPIEGTSVLLFLELDPRGISHRAGTLAARPAQSAIVAARVLTSAEPAPFEFTAPGASAASPPGPRDSARISTLLVRRHPPKSGVAPVVSIKRSKAALSALHAPTQAPPMPPSVPAVPVLAAPGAQSVLPSPSPAPLLPESGSAGTVAPDLGLPAKLAPPAIAPALEVPVAPEKEEIMVSKAAEFLEPKFVSKNTKTPVKKATSAAKVLVSKEKVARPVKPKMARSDEPVVNALPVDSQARKPKKSADTPAALFMRLAESLLGNPQSLAWSSKIEESDAPFIDVLLHLKHPGVVLLVHRTGEKALAGVAFMVQVKGVGILRPELMKNAQDAVSQRALQGGAVNLKSAHFSRPKSAEAIRAIRMALSALYSERGLVESFQPFVNRESSTPGLAGEPARIIRRRRRAKKATTAVPFVGAMPLDPQVLQFYNDAVLSELGLKRLRVKLKNPVSIHADQLVCKGPVLLSRRPGTGPDPKQKFQKTVAEPTWGAVLTSIEESLSSGVKSACLEDLYAAEGRLEFELAH